MEFDYFWRVPGQGDVAFKVLREVVAAGVKETRQAKVADFHPEIAGDENVSRGQVTVDNIFTLWTKNAGHKRKYLTCK